MKIFGGVSTALITPFKRGEVDYQSLKNLVKHQLDSGTEGFVVSGSTGEAATLTLKEKLTILQFVLSEVGKQVPVIVGAGTFNTSETCELIQAFEKCSPDGYLLVTPYYNKPPQRGLVAHFLEAAASTTLPIILYNVPGRTACTLSTDSVYEIAQKAKNVVATKEAAGDLEVIKKLKSQCDESFQILSGDDPTFLEAISLGAGGVISVVSHVIPKKCVEFSRAVLKARDNKDQVQKFSAEILDISEKIFCESNPIPIKWALKEMGVIESDEVRLPLVTLDPKWHKSLKESLKKVGAL